MTSDSHYDLVVIGAGIIGLATAYTARQRGLRVAVIERHAQCVGASVRNFGFVTVTGQRRGEHWRRALRTRDVWQRIAPQAGIDVIHQGLYVLARRPQAMDVFEAFLRTEMGEGCRLLSVSEAARDLPVLQAGLGVLHSPHERRVESRDAIPRLSRWLAESLGVDFRWNTPVLGISLPQVHTSKGVIHAAHCVVCPGHELDALFPEVIAQAGIRLCTLQMMRVRPAQPVRLPGSIMSDLSLVRYEGYADLPEAAPLKALLQTEQAAHLRDGVHLIAVQSADGSLVVGDSHVYGDAEAPFGRSDIDELITDELHRVLRLPGACITERWTGTYASAGDVVYKARPAPGVAVGIVTGGTGASTSFAFAEELVDLALG
ncbi:FAD dependent oxidoreductase TIGR03364 [Sphaerotilus hippei]|uniref:FAD dependent oxidoreductase TIGR03364 n=1 Tax=Sphaerotilus hippei TaxID=744406 RepID=A0A318GYL5_9BURK|nr:TIGR03364 family FAD-dependent oxidoreductase [Sphaerotilus hippei]PXW95212.1 FAD dependent oxidoreductase TIGR03364 [Sphaerotilus hippei]